VRIDAVCKAKRAESKCFSGPGSSTPDRFSGLGWRWDGGHCCRLDFGTNQWINRRTVDFRAKHPGHDSARDDATGYNTAWNYSAGNKDAGHGIANPGYCSPDAGYRDPGNYPKHNHDANPGDDT
jgi:hypothetical protein